MRLHTSLCLTLVYTQSFCANDSKIQKNGKEKKGFYAFVFAFSVSCALWKKIKQCENRRGPTTYRFTTGYRG